jgi:hypothetical protein
MGYNLRIRSNLAVLAASGAQCRRIFNTLCDLIALTQSMKKMALRTRATLGCKLTVENNLLL